jgi:hypothetical protein
MNYNFLLVAILLLSGVTGSRAHAYEVGTHSRLTYEAYVRSSFGTQGKLAQLGIVDINGILGEKYVEFDNISASSLVRNRFPYDRTVAAASMLVGPDTETLQAQSYRIGLLRPFGWMMAGAIREDDGGSITSAYQGLGMPVFLDPPLKGVINRYCNHFYDPIQGQAGSLGSAAYSGSCDTLTVRSAPAWALALDNGQNIFAAQTDANERRNTFTIVDAKEAMWRATTGYEKTMTTKVAPTAAQRLRYWATAFRSLGDVLHTLQDMAQPQHTRNEFHGAGEASAYEEVVDAQITSGATRPFIYTPASNFAPRARVAPTYDQTFFDRAGIVIPRFGAYSDFWHQATNAAGLASYSNRGFLTAIKGIGNQIYSQPPTLPTDPTYTEITQSRPLDGGQLLTRRYLTYPVPDALSGNTDRIRMTSKSVLSNVMSAALGTQPSSPRLGWVLDLNTMNDHAYLQLPRAVAYSAGLIDYFFRGQFKIEPPALGMYAYTDLAPSANTNPDATKNYAFKKLAFKLTNTTPAIAHSATNQILDQSFAVKSLVAVVKFHRNTGGGAGWKADLSTEYGAPGQSFLANRDKTNSKSAYDINQDESIVISTSCTVDGASPPGTSNA